MQELGIIFFMPSVPYASAKLNLTLVYFDVTLIM